MDSNRKLSVSEAKANFSASVEGLHPLESAAAAHPLLLLGAAVVVGVLVGRSGTKILKKTGLLASAILLSPTLPSVILKKLIQ